MKMKCQTSHETGSNEYMESDGMGEYVCTVCNKTFDFVDDFDRCLDESEV